MKRKKIIFLLLCWLLMLLAGCSKKKDDDESKDFLTQYMYDYTIIQENNDGTTEISVIAPDFEAIMENVTIDKLESEINIQNINNLLNEYPDCKKEYVVIVSDLSDKEEIEDVLNDRIAEELFKLAITNIEYKEEWSTKE